jgi:membrane-associated protease RseP (regulator of RpoE activity)
MNAFTRNKNLVLFAGAVVALFAVMSLLDRGNATYSGFSTDPTSVVTQVRPDSPAAAAGFEVGDQLVSTGGIDITDAKANSRRPRSEIGETREYVVDRGGSQDTLTLTFAALPGRQAMLQLVGWLTGVFFLVFGIWPYLKNRNEKTGLLVTTGLSLAVLFIGPPYFASFAIRTAIGAIIFPILLIGLASLLHLMLLLPNRSPWLDKPSAGKILYMPAALIAVFFLFLTLVQPDSTNSLSTISNILFGVFFTGLFGASLVVLVRTYLRSSADERRVHGLHVVVAGVVLALVPLVVSIAMNVLAPKVILPGSDFFGLTFILLPIALAYAVMKTPEAAEAA